MQHKPSSPEMLHEHRAGLQRSSAVILLPFEEAIERPGYISVFSYPPETVTQIRETGTTAGLRGLPLSCKLVYLDVDDNDAAADAAEAKLQEMGLGYERYSSGNRGFHFHIPCEEIVRVDTPHRVKVWVQANFQGVDDSLYKTSGIIRTPGTFHHKKPGSRKTLVSSGTGKILDLLAAEVPAPVSYVSLDEDADAAAVLDWLWMEPSFSGGRNREIYRRAFLCRLAGYDRDEAEGLLLNYNVHMVRPALSPHEVITTARSAYRE
jgi:hypothetical protein